jgi:transposase
VGQHRRTLEAIAWKYRTNSPWRDFPVELGPFQSIMLSDAPAEA